MSLAELATETQSWNLSHAIRECAEKLDSINPSEVAEAVLEQIPADQMVAVLAALLPEKCRTVLTRVRSNPGSAVPSARWGAVRKSTNNVRLWPVNIGPDDWTVLGDCTVSDLEIACSLYKVQIDQLQERLHRLRIVMRRMRKAGVEVAGDLSDEDLAVLL